MTPAKRKEKILGYLENTPNHTLGVAETLMIPIRQVEYIMKLLYDQGYLTRDDSTVRNKIYKRTRKVYYLQEKNHVTQLAPHIRIIKNLSRPGSDYAWQRKKRGSGRGLGSLQSGMQGWELA